jgi:hypothetical protein
VWRLRCSVFRGTPMAFFSVYFKELNCYDFSISSVFKTKDGWPRGQPFRKREKSVSLFFV